LGLRGILAEEWDSFTKRLSAAGVTLGDTDDTLMWTGGDASGKTTVIFFYSALVSTKNYQQEANWKQKIMEVEYPIKNKTFHLVDHLQEDFNLGRASEKRMGRAWMVCFMQKKL
jgi:hypothetical protein